MNIFEGRSVGDFLPYFIPLLLAAALATAFYGELRDKARYARRRRSWKPGGILPSQIIMSVIIIVASVGFVLYILYAFFSMLPELPDIGMLPRVVTVG